MTTMLSSHTFTEADDPTDAIDRACNVRLVRLAGCRGVQGCGTQVTLPSARRMSRSVSSAAVTGQRIVTSWERDSWRIRWNERSAPPNSGGVGSHGVTTTR